VTRAELERRVDALAEEHQGAAFAAAVRLLADGLGQEARDELGTILLERAGGLEWALTERYRAKGWLRRMTDPAARRPR
jgi:hypothetical protein